MNKYIKDGQTAVLISPDFGAGWYTWNREYPGMLFDPDIVQAVLDEDLVKAEQIAKEKFPDAYLGGIYDLRVVWLETGTRFEVEEYEGNESIMTVYDLPHEA